MRENSESDNDDNLTLRINSMATQTLFPMEGRLVLPGVTGSMLSGMAQSFYNYGSLRTAPLHVKSSLHLIFLFGIWWAVTDRQSQTDMLKLSIMREENDNDNSDSSTTIQEEMMRVWKRRRLYNTVSCLFVAVLYGMMVLKPGFGG